MSHTVAMAVLQGAAESGEGKQRLKANCLALPVGETAVGQSSGGCNYCVIVSVALPGRRWSARGVGCVDRYRNR